MGSILSFLKGHRVTHKPPTAPINKMASFSAAFGVLGSEGGLLLNFKGRFGARVTTVLTHKLQSEWNKISGDCKKKNIGSTFEFDDAACLVPGRRAEGPGTAAALMMMRDSERKRKTHNCCISWIPRMMGIKCPTSEPSSFLFIFFFPQGTSRAALDN